MRRKFLSVVLCVCMMLTMAPFAFAAGETASATTNPPSSSSGSGSGAVTAGITTEDALKKAISAASDNATIKLDRDITLTSTLNITKNITLNGDGHTISGSVASGTSFIDVSIPNNGDFTLTNCKIVPTAQVTSNAAISLSVAGKVTVTDCTFGASSDTAGHMYNGLEFSQTVPMGDTTITGNTFYGGAFRHNCISFYKMNDNATININNNNFSNLNWDTTNAVRVSNYGSNTAIINLNDNTYSDHGTTGANQSYAGLLVFQKTASNNDNFTKLTVNINNFSTTSDSQLLYVYDDINNIITTNQPIIKGDSTISKFFSAKIDDVHYTTLPDAVEAAASGDTITLLNDVTLPSMLAIKKDLTLDLNSKTLSRAGSVLDLYNNTTIKNGTINCTYQNSDDPTSTSCAVWVNQTANLMVADDVTFKTSNQAFAVAFDGSCTAATVNFKGIITGGNGITMNGNINKLDANNTLIIDGASIKATGHGMYLAGYGTTKFSIKNSTISGSTGIEIRAGKLNVDNSTITGNGTFKCESNPSGTTTDGVGIAIAQHTTKLPIDVTISGGNISGTYAVYESDPENNGTEYTKDVKLSITGGNFTGSISSVDVKNFITGGYFTSDPTAYLANGKAAVESELAGYNYKVADKTSTPATVAAANPTVDTSKISETQQQAAIEIANQLKADNNTVSGDGLTAAASTIANNNTVSTNDGKSALESNHITTGTNSTRIVVQTYMDIDITAVDITSKTLTLDITPMYRTVATTAINDADISLSGDGRNAVDMSKSGTLAINKPVTVKIPLPASFVTKKPDGSYDNIYVQHKGYEYTASVSNQSGTLYATFTNPHGFSSFTITAAPTAVAEVNGTSYINFQDAVDAVDNNGTIKALKDITSTVSGNKIFTVNANSKTVTLTAAPGYSLTNSGDTYTVSHQSSGSPGSSGGSISAPTTYAVNVNAATNGAVAADKKTASKGTTVTVTASPSKGYVVDAVKVVDKDGKDVAVTGKDGKYVFTMPASAVTVTGAFKAETPAPVALPFTDVKSGNWFYDAVKYAYAQGLMTGTSATTFAPNGTMNRAMIVTVLYRLEKSPAVTGASKFTDVPAGQWYSNAVAWAAANKIVNGYDETTFGPMNAVTREQMAAILFRYEQVKGLENVTLEENLNRFPDQNKISAYAIPALQWAVGQKIINGNADGTLDPTGTATRAQVAQIFTNLLNK